MDDSKIISLDDHRLTGPALPPAPHTALVPVFDEQVDVPPEGFSRLPDGIYIVDSTGEDQNMSWLCSPLRVTARFRGSDGKGWGRVVEIVDSDGTTHALQIEESDLETRPGPVRSALASAGVSISTQPKAGASVIKFIRQSKPSRTLLRTDRLGWVDKRHLAFVLGNGQVIGSGDVLCAPGLMTTVDRDQDAGTLEDWQSGVAARCVGNDLLIVGVSLALAGPLLDLMNIEGGGLHLRGASSSGKTTILQAAVSVWGPPNTLRSWRTTANALEGVAARSNGKLVALDELAEVSPQAAFEAAYMLSNGYGKGRALSTGGSRPDLVWKVAVLSSGEISMAAKMAEANLTTMDGQEVRLIDIDADMRRFGAFDQIHGTSIAADFSNALKMATTNSFGTAGPAFVKCLIDSGGTKDASKFVARFRQSVRAAFPNLAGVEDRIVSRFALIIAAGELATRYGITGWDRGAALQSTHRVLTEVLTRRHEPSPTSQAAVASIERTRQFLVAHGSEFVDVRTGGVPTAVNVIGWRDGNSFMFTKDTWHRLHAGFDPLVSARHLKDARFLQPGEGSNLARKAPNSVPERPRLYVVRNSLLGVSEL